MPGVLHDVFLPVEDLARDMHDEFVKVPLKKLPRNKVAVFRISPCLVEDYERAVAESRGLCRRLYVVMEAQLERLSETTSPAEAAGARSALESVIERIKAVLPHRLVGREDSGVLKYTEDVRGMLHSCLAEMILTWKDPADSVKGATHRRGHAMGSM
jgi:hypothetical protein